MKALIALAALACTGCISVTETTQLPPPPTRAASPEEPAILAAVDAFLHAVGNHDVPAGQAVSVAEGTAYFQRTPKDGPPGAVQRRPLSGLIGPGDPFIERYWSPTVLVRGSIAMVWAPYELRDNGQVVHCGIDGFDMVKLDGQWKVGNVVSTMEPNACDELHPPSVSAMRPRDGWKETPLN